MDDARKLKNESTVMLLTAIFIIILNLIFYYFKPGQEITFTLARNLFPLICSMFAVGSLLRVTFYLKTWDITKTAWFALACGFLFWFLKKGYYAISELSWGITPLVPSLGDRLWLLGLPFILTGLILFIYNYQRGGLIFGNRFRYVAASTVIIIITFFLINRFFLPAINDHQLNFAQKFFTLVYPLADLLILMLSFVLVLITSLLGKGLFSKPWKFLVSGFICLTIGDILYSYYHWLAIYDQAGYLDIINNAGYLFIAASAFYQKDLMEKF